MMFEVGRSYRITTGVGESEGYSSYTIIEVKLPLIKVQGAGITTVFNTGSPSFVSAELDDEQAKQEARDYLNNTMLLPDPSDLDL